MSFVTGDSFDPYTTGAQGASSLQYTSFAPNTSATGRFAVGRCITFSGSSGNFTAAVTALNDPILAFAFQLSAIGGSGILVSLNDATSGTNLNVFVNADGTVSIRRGTNVIAGPSTTAISTGAWHWIELKAAISTGATGSVTLRLDETTIISTVSSVQTSTVANITRLVWTGVANFSTQSWDDWVLFNTSGAFNNDFPGELRGDTFFPTGAGTNAQFTPSTGANWQNVDDNPPNDDTDYNASSTIGQIDSFVHTAQSLTGNIVGCVHLPRGRKDDAGGRSFRGYVKSGVTTADNGSDHVMTSSYQYFPETWETDPHTGSQWTLTGLNASEWGYKVIA